MVQISFLVEINHFARRRDRLRRPAAQAAAVRPPGPAQAAAVRPPGRHESVDPGAADDALGAAGGGARPVDGARAADVRGARLGTIACVGDHRRGVFLAYRACRRAGGGGGGRRAHPRFDLLLRGCPVAVALTDDPGDELRRQLRGKVVQHVLWDGGGCERGRPHQCRAARRRESRKRHGAPRAWWRRPGLLSRGLCASHGTRATCCAGTPAPGHAGSGSSAPRGGHPLCMLPDLPDLLICGSKPKNDGNAVSPRRVLRFHRFLHIQCRTNPYLRTLPSRGKSYHSIQN